MIDWGEKLEEKIAMLPDSPGCYLMKDDTGTIIYVGKAVNLKNRVRSYFRDTAHTPKVAAMISHIDDFDILLCETNLEALILECNLIKQHRPYYNILLKDDKHYPYLKVDLREPYPRLELCRRMEKDGAKYFGPYIGAGAVRQVIETVRGVFPLRTCRQALPAKTPKRPCVNYDIGRCMAPCAGKCSQEAYGEMIRGVLNFLEGDYAAVIRHLKGEMNAAAEAMRYEQAARIRDRIRDVEGLMERQIAMRTDNSEQDLIAVSMDGLDAMVQLLYVRGGRMIGGDHFPLPGEGGEDPGEVIAGFMTQYYENDGMIPRNILCQTLSEESRRNWKPGFGGKRAARSRWPFPGGAKSMSSSCWRKRTRGTRWKRGTPAGQCMRNGRSGRLRIWEKSSAWTAIREGLKAMTSPIPRETRACPPWSSLLTANRPKRNTGISGLKRWSAPTILRPIMKPCSGATPTR